jgi:hypothetical protein
MNRCGTNYLCDMLRLHPAFKPPRLVVEDYALKHSDLLIKYAEQTFRRWGSGKIPLDDATKARLVGSIGAGIVSFLGDQLDQQYRILTKTPSPDNLDKFFLLFPGAKLLVLVRDGRDVVESAARSWRRVPRPYWMRRWKKGARSILKFQDGVGRGLEGSRWALVRYEDLINHKEETVRRILDLLDLDTSLFNWEKLPRLPLRGSSSHFGEEGQLNWRLVPKPGDFRPVGRWATWSPLQKSMFKMIAGRELIRLGYAGNQQW